MLLNSSKSNNTELVMDAIMRARQAGEEISLEVVSRYLYVDKRTTQEWLRKEGSSFSYFDKMIGFCEALIRVEEACDEWVSYILEEKGDGNTVPNLYLKDVLEEPIDKKRFKDQDPSGRFSQMTNLNLKDYMNLRQSDKILWHIWPVIEPERGITGVSERTFDNTQSLTEQLKRDYGHTAQEIKKTGFVPKGAPEKFDPANKDIESMFATVVRAQAKKVFELTEEADDSLRKIFLEGALQTVFGESKPVIWNTEEISVLKTFVRWASDRNLISTSFVFEPDPVWWAKFQQFDDIWKKEIEAKIKKSQDSDSEPDKSSFYMIQMLRLNERGYNAFYTDGMVDDDHPCELATEYRKKGMKGGKFYDGAGRIFSPMDGETREEFEEWVEVNFES
jgi:hypothetical protein